MTTGGTSMEDRIIRIEVELARLSGEARVIPYVFKYGLLPLIVILGGLCGVNLFM